MIICVKRVVWNKSIWFMIKEWKRKKNLYFNIYLFLIFNLFENNDFLKLKILLRGVLVIIYTIVLFLKGWWGEFSLWKNLKSKVLEWLDR